jgi:hypothetical protein
MSKIYLLLHGTGGEPSDYCHPVIEVVAAAFDRAKLLPKLQEILLENPDLKYSEEFDYYSDDGFESVEIEEIDPIT